MTARDFPPLPPEADAASLLARIEVAGIVGMGGAGYPTAAKLRAARAGGADLAIGNGMACDPGASADLALLRQRLEAVVSGLRIVCRCLEAPGGPAGACGAADRELVGGEGRLPGPRFVLAVPPGSGIPPPAKAVAVDYPAGDERRLVAQVAGRQVPAAGWPTDVGVVVLNVATLFAIHEAVRLGKAPRRRLVTVGGQDRWLRLGRPLATLTPLLVVAQGDGTGSGSSPPPHGAMRVGGPLTGRPAALDAVVEATTFHVGLTPQAGPCIRCGWCRTACPEALLPDLLHAAFEAGGEGARTTDCTECGACTAACPASIDLVNEIRALKRKRHDAASQARRAAAARQRFLARTARLRGAEAARDERRAKRLRRPRQW